MTPETDANLIRASDRPDAQCPFSAPTGPLGLDADAHEALAILARPSGDELRAIAGWEP